MDKRNAEFLLIAFLTILFCTTFSVSTFWMFVEKLQAVERQAAGIAQSASEASLQTRSVVASEQVATLADEMFLAAAFQAGAAVLGTLLLIGTVVFTIRAAQAAQASAVEAKSANEATRELVEHTKDTTLVELRPYVSLKEICTAETDDRCTVLFKFHNFGKTPAENFRAKLRHGLSFDFDSCAVPRKNQRTTQAVTIMPGQEHVISTFEESDENLDMVAIRIANLLIQIEFSFTSRYYAAPVTSKLKAYLDQDRLMRGVASLMD